MSTRDGVTGKTVVQHIPPKSVTATVTPADGDGVDTKGAEAVTLVLSVGDVSDLSASPQGDGTWAIKVQESDTDENSEYADIKESARIIPGSGVSAPNSSTGVVLTINAPAQLNKAYAIGVISPKRYVRLIATAADTPGASLLGCVAILERLSVVNP